MRSEEGLCGAGCGSRRLGELGRHGIGLIELSGVVY
jgi:hypothetical protein